MRALRVLGALIVTALAVVGLLALAGAFDDGASSAAARDDGLASAGRINRIYDRASPGVVFIQAEVGAQPRRAIATGTGFVIDGDGRIVTNAHVVERARDVRVRFSESTLIDADVIGVDEANDLALLRVDPGDADLHPLPLGDSGTVDVGDPVVAIGNPLGLRDTITSGIVSAEHRRITSPNGVTIDDVIQTDAAVNPGNSGGPLLDAAGRVIGVNAQIATAGGRGSIGIAFAIPVETVKRVVADLEDDGDIDRPTLGVTAATVTPALARQLDLGTDRGALVVSVAPRSPAARIGLHGDGGPSGALTGEGDVIVRVGDDRIRSSGDLAGAIGSLRPGTTVELEYVRDGEHRTVEVRPAAQG
jgi:S1-C subfamily serine protease